MSDDMKRLIVVLQSKGQVITTEDVEYISGVISENEWLGFEEEAENEERPQGEWIPFGERLPEGKIDPMTNDFELVLCSTVWDVVRPYKFGKPIGHDKAHFWSGGGIMDDYVIAWMPLPEAYKEAEKEE